LDPSTSGGKILKAYAVEHKDKTAATEIGHQLLRSTRALEDREYHILTILTELMDNERRGIHDICATTRQAVRSLRLSIKEKASGGRAKAIACHHRVFRFVWRLAEQLYASQVSRVVFSTVGNAILSPAFEGADLFSWRRSAVFFDSQPPTTLTSQSPRSSFTERASLHLTPSLLVRPISLIQLTEYRNKICFSNLPG
jgi:hypothetical protein